MANTYKLIASSTVGSGGVTNIEFTSIPATYTDLFILLSARTDRGGGADNDGISVAFNNSGGTSYNTLRLYGANGDVNNNTTTSAATLNFYGITGAGATSSTFGNSSIYIPNYNSSNYKSVSCDTASENNAAATLLGIHSGLWSNTAAITSIKLTPTFGTNFNQYSTAYLYGIKNS